jgi:hypothetical protein
MAIWFMDGFDHYTPDTYGAGGAGTAGTLADVYKKWTGNVGNAPTVITISPFYARQQPGQGLGYITANAGGIYKARGSNQATMFAGVAVMFTSAPAANAYIPIMFMDGNTEQCSVRTDGANHFTFQRTTTVLATSTNTFSINTWYYLEAMATVHNSTGQYEVRVNGTSVNWIPQSAANQNTRAGAANNYTNGIGIHYANAALSMRIDDLYYGDTTGSNTTFLGPQMIVTLRPSGAGNYAQWTPNMGNNFGNVNELYPDGDVSFNQSSTANQIDTFLYPDLPIAAGTVSAIQHVLYAKQDAGAARSIAPLQRSGGTDYPGTTFNLTTSYQMLLDPKDLNPVDTAAWAIADVDGAEFGYKLIS